MYLKADVLEEECVCTMQELLSDIGWPRAC